MWIRDSPVREPPHRKAGADKFMEFPGTVLGGGVVINVIVNVALVNAVSYTHLDVYKRQI